MFYLTSIKRNHPYYTRLANGYVVFVDMYRLMTKGEVYLCRTTTVQEMNNGYFTHDRSRNLQLYYGTAIKSSAAFRRPPELTQVVAMLECSPFSQGPKEKCKLVVEAECHRRGKIVEVTISVSAFYLMFRSYLTR